MRNKTFKSDKVLIIGMKYGDEECFDELFRKYYPRFHTYTNRLTHDHYLAEDIMQNVFLKLWLNRLKLDERYSVVSYLYVLTKNEILNQMRYDRNHPCINDKLLMVCRHLYAENDTDYKELYSKVLEAVERLPKRRREVFKMNRFEFMSAAEIAERLGLSVRTVEKHLELAMRNIRQTLGPVLSILLFFF